MLKVTKDKVYLTRGDTAFLTVTITDENGDDYEYREGDKVYFRLKQGPTSKTVLVEKEVNTETNQLLLYPEDTIDLKFATYHYEIELVTVENYHFTVIENAEFVIGPELEVHNHE